LGLPLAKRWQNAGDEVFATTRHQPRAAEFSSIGLNPLVLDVTDASSVGQLTQTAFDTVVIAVGMDRSRYKSVHDVYVGGQGGKACLAAEQLLLDSRFADRATILRMAGLYGNERVPTKATIAAKQWSKLSPEGYLNLIHADDAVSATCVAAEQQLCQQLFLVADSNPTLRGEYYQFLADRFELGPIPWADHEPDPNSRGSANKRISNKKLLQQTGLVLEHPDFRSGLQDSM